MSNRSRLAVLTASTALALLSTAGPSLAQDMSSLGGFARTPDGFDGRDVQLKACLGTADPCDQKATGRPFNEGGMFSLQGPRGDYVVTGWLDVDRDGKLSDGDLTGVSGGGAPLPPGGMTKYSFDMKPVTMPRPSRGGGRGEGTIHGIVTGPAGANMDRLVAVACPEPLDNCNADSVMAPVRMNGDQGRYRIENLRPDLGYVVMVWQDNDGDDSPSDGDLMRSANNGEPVMPGSGPQDVRVGVFHGGKIYGRLEAVPGADASPPQEKPTGGSWEQGGGSGGGMTGSWSQSSSVAELIMMPKVKVMPGSAPGIGTAVGSMGSGGSHVTTMIVNEYASVPVNRRMTLDVQSDGAFRWMITRSHTASGSCRITVREEKAGRLQMSGGQVTFAISGGSASSENSCKPSGDTSTTRGSSSESYDYSVAGSTLRIRGSGGVNWVFNRR